MAAAAILKARQAACATSYRGALIIRVLASITFRALVRPVTQACHGRTTYSKPPAAWSARPAALPRRIRREPVWCPALWRMLS